MLSPAALTAAMSDGVSREISPRIDIRALCFSYGTTWTS